MKCRLFLLQAVAAIIFSTTESMLLSKISTALNNRDIVLGTELMKALELNEFGTEQFVGQLCRSSVSRTSTVIDAHEFIMSIITLPPSFTMPLHSRPGTVLSKLLYGTLILRDFEILQFVADDDALKINSFEHEDAFAGGEDCVCRGGKCPRREGCIFWVNKQMRDSGSSLYVSEHGYSSLSGGDCEVIPETSGPRELINNSKESAVIVQVLIKDLDQADMIEDTPVLQFYRADRLQGAGVKGNKLKVYATDEPLGLIPMYVPWRGTKI